MIRRAAITVLGLYGSLNLSYAQSNPAMTSSQSQQPKAESKDKADPKDQTSALMGCVDEQDGKWVLVNDQTMAIIANLAADGFPTEAFAKYMGHKVNVRGTVIPGGSSSTFKVREIKSISETCAVR
jgi:hypothetical protein